jgi:hypothetical protein
MEGKSEITPESIQAVINKNAEDQWREMQKRTDAKPAPPLSGRFIPNRF